MGRKIKEPRDIEKYGEAEHVANALEQLASNIRAKGGYVKFTITLRLWHPSWLTNPPECIVDGATFTNKEQRSQD